MLPIGIHPSPPFTVPPGPAPAKSRRSIVRAIRSISSLVFIPTFLQSRDFRENWRENSPSCPSRRALREIGSREGLAFSRLPGGPRRLSPVSFRSPPQKSATNSNCAFSTRTSNGFLEGAALAFDRSGVWWERRWSLRSFLSFFLFFFLDWFCRFEKVGEPRFCVVRMNIRVCVNFLVVCNIWYLIVDVILTW